MCSRLYVSKYVCMHVCVLELGGGVVPYSALIPLLLLSLLLLSL
uniref:Uncharacterized protein n=1 Tax=Anguilla anguilla TaxID=7936 RepID=A0A0E9T5R8_ANGAN